VVFWSKLNTRRIVSSALNMGYMLPKFHGHIQVVDLPRISTLPLHGLHLPRSTTSYFMRVDWETVGRCVNRALHDLEPERSRRLDGLVNIGIDKISYKKGHK